MLHAKLAFHRLDGAIFRFVVGAGFVAGAVILVGKPDLAGAHGFAGERFFPATILTDDPFVADEMSLPTVTRNPAGADGSQLTTIETDISKRITKDFAFTIQDQWDYLQPKGMGAATGLDTLHTGLQYQLFVNGPHEAIGLLNLGETWGHTGRVAALGQPDYTTLSPGFDFGKGFGDLPDTMPFIRPFAITGNLSADFPTKTESAGTPNPNNFNYGFAFEYSLEYLQHHVKDVGITPPFDHMVPLVEVAFTTPINRITPGVTTTGTIQPGLIWSGQYFQISAEAIIPATHATGHGVGGLVQFHIYLDDLLPKSFGTPIMEW
jgi:hypothetical protein